MSRHYTAITFTPSVRAAQKAFNAEAVAQRMHEMAVKDDEFGPKERAFIAARDSFYMASVGEEGWPYVQFRGGPMGFLKVIDDRRLAYADFRGNRQYISTGNLSQNPRVSLFLMDYPNRRRLKIMAEARIHRAEAEPELLKMVEDPTYRARIERVIVFELAAFDWNCPQHITPRFTQAQWEAQMGVD